MTKRQNRMVLVALLIAGAILAVTLLLQALGNNSNYFYSPTSKLPLWQKQVNTTPKYKSYIYQITRIPLFTHSNNNFSNVALLIAGAILAVTLLLQALGNNSNYFYSPTSVKQGKAPTDRSFRMFCQNFGGNKSTIN
jgi:cytochrome c-type biogenesis protein CcmE